VNNTLYNMQKAKVDALFTDVLLKDQYVKGLTAGLAVISEQIGALRGQIGWLECELAWLRDQQQRRRETPPQQPANPVNVNDASILT